MTIATPTVRFSAQFSRWRSRLFGLLGVMLLSSGCGDVPSTSQAVISDHGDLTINYVPSEIEEYQWIQESLEATEFFDDLANELNTEFAFPEDIEVFFAECGEANAFYDPNSVEITMCYELIEQYMKIFEDEIETQEDYDNEVIDAALFTFFHELGHALVDQYELPITGKEEDAVDDFATVLLIDVYEDEAAFLSGLWQFEGDAIEEQDHLDDLPFWGEHSLSSQRFYNTACLIYGSDPDEYEFLIEEDYLPSDRAERCPEEYEQKSRAWFTLIEPYLQGE
ncbi:MAG: DUF4344 domain-containing metallopeptidase [Spirulina sp. SIO3F2]|nr:DUF4344 domain-containing metallopeptidase [Spirulina sp. SIO3F2]